MDYSTALNEVYIKSGIGNTLMSEFYKKRTQGGWESEFSKLAVYMEWKYNMFCLENIQTEHIYDFILFLSNRGLKDSTLKHYISSYRMLYSNNTHIFSKNFELPTNIGYEKWVKNQHKT